MEASVKMISFLDLAGHEKYLKSTLSGIIGRCPQLCLLSIGADQGIRRMTRENLILTTALHVPIVVVITKIDLVSTDILMKLQNDIMNILLAAKRKFISMKSMEDIYSMFPPLNVTDEVNQSSHDDDILNSNTSTSGSRATYLGNNSIPAIVPIFSLSCVTGEGLDLLRTFLFQLPVQSIPNSNTLNNHSVEAIVLGSFMMDTVGSDKDEYDQLSSDEEYFNNRQYDDHNAIHNTNISNTMSIRTGAKDTVNSFSGNTTKGGEYKGSAIVLVKVKAGIISVGDEVRALALLFAVS